MIFFSFPLYLIATTVEGEVTRLEANLGSVRASLTHVPTPVPQVQELQNALTRVQAQANQINAILPSLLAAHTDWPAIMSAIGNYDPNQIALTSLTSTGTHITLSGLAVDESAVMTFADNLDRSALFSRVVVQSIQMVPTPVVTWTITPGITVIPIPTEPPPPLPTPMIPSPTPCGAGISGRAYLDLNHNGNADGGDPGLPNVLVTLQMINRTAIANAVTDGFGYYHFNNLPFNRYVVEADAPAGYYAATPNMVAVNLFECGAFVGLDFGFNPIVFTATPTSTPSSTPTPTSTPSATATPTNTSTATPTATSTLTLAPPALSQSDQRRASPDALAAIADTRLHHFHPAADAYSLPARRGARPAPIFMAVKFVILLEAKVVAP
jgi:hypothetical protein